MTGSVLLLSKLGGRTSMGGPDLDYNLARLSLLLKNRSGVGKSCSQPLAGDPPDLARFHLVSQLFSSSCIRYISKLYPVMPVTKQQRTKTDRPTTTIDDR
jgi:hypothetical protein